MSKVLIIGAGGVGGVVTHKCAQAPDIFTAITLASRTESKCQAIAAQVDYPVKTARVNADNVPELVELIRHEQPSLVINVALAVPGPAHHGGVPGNRGELPRYRQLRAARYGEVRVQLAVGLS